MQVEIRKLRNGKEYYSFVYRDNGKRIRLKQENHPKFDSYEQAVKWARIQGANIDCVKVRAMKRLAWKNQFFDFLELSRKFTLSIKKTQPNSWENCSFYFEHYVLQFFLEIKSVNNINNWSIYFEEFKSWLEESAYTIKNNPALISYSSKNHCIKALNAFLIFARNNQLVDPSNVYKISVFPASKLKSRDVEALIDKNEYECIYSILKEMNEDVAVMFQCAYWTGMRFSEIFGLSLDDLIQGKIGHNSIGNFLDKHEIDYCGYIVLESQPKSKIRLREKDGSILRKPLKGKKVISTKNSRLIPIIRKELFNNLVKYYKIQTEKYNSGVYGKDRKHYIFFEDVNRTLAMNNLKKAYEKTSYKFKSFHCCRHTRCTELVGETGDFSLAQTWLGHSRLETTMKYIHIFQQANMNAKKKTQEIDFLD